MDLGYFGSTAFGAALIAGGRIVWRWFEKKDGAALAAKEEVAVLLKQRIAVLEADVTRKDETIGQLGRKCDGWAKKYEDLERRAGVVLGKMRQDSSVDETEFEETLTTGVRNMADLLASAKPKSDPPIDSLPPGVRKELELYDRDITTTPPDPIPPLLPRGTK